MGQLEMGIQIRMGKRARYSWCCLWSMNVAWGHRQKISVNYMYAYTLYWIELNRKPEWNRCSAIWDGRRVAFVSAEKLLKEDMLLIVSCAISEGSCPCPPGSAIALSKFYRNLRCSHHTNNPIICHRFHMMWSIKLVQLFRGYSAEVTTNQLYT